MRCITIYEDEYLWEQRVRSLWKLQEDEELAEYNHENPMVSPVMFNESLKFHIMFEQGRPR